MDICKFDILSAKGLDSLLDDMPYMPQDSGHISCKHIKSTLSMNSAPLLYFTRSGQDHFNINWSHCRLYMYVVRFMQHLGNWWFNLLRRFFKGNYGINWFIPLFTRLHMHRRKMYQNIHEYTASVKAIDPYKSYHRKSVLNWIVVCIVNRI